MADQIPADPSQDQALRESERRFRVLFDNANDAILIVDKEDGKVADANEAACRMLGYPRAELIGTPLSRIHREDAERAQGLAATVFACGSGRAAALRCTTRSGEVLTVQISAATLELGDRTRLVAFLRDVTDGERLRLENADLRVQFDEGLGFGSLVGRSAAMRKVLDQIDRVAQTDATVLVAGESGTGKELVATEVHRRSARRERPMVRVNCASIPANLFESEFFGHVRGAFTGAGDERVGRFQVADKGTLFLDEIGEVPLELQAKLLRVLQERQFERVGESKTRSVDVRIIAASNRDLAAEARAGRFREDLYYRLSVFPIVVPPLRDRPGDVRPLAEHCLRLACRRLKVPPLTLDAEQLDRLSGYAWPGNVRELQNVLERAVIVSPHGPLTVELGAGASVGAAPRGAELSLEDLDRLEREIIVAAIRGTEGKIYGDDGAAARLNLKPTTLASRMKRLGIPRGAQD